MVTGCFIEKLDVQDEMCKTSCLYHVELTAVDDYTNALA